MSEPPSILGEDIDAVRGVLFKRPPPELEPPPLEGLTEYRCLKCDAVFASDPEVRHWLWHPDIAPRVKIHRAVTGCPADRGVRSFATCNDTANLETYVPRFR